MSRDQIILQTFTFQKHKSGEYFEVPAGHGNSAALCEITRRWSFHGTSRGHRPSAFLCGTPFVSPMKAEIPVGAFANRIAVPVPSPSFHLKNN